MGNDSKKDENQQKDLPKFEVTVDTTVYNMVKKDHAYAEFDHTESEKIKNQRPEDYKKYKDVMKCIEETKIVVFGAPLNYRPFADITAEKDGGTPLIWGHDYELALLFAEYLSEELKTKIKAKFVQTAWKDLITDTNADRFDITIGGIQINKDRLENVLMTDGHFDFWKAPIVAKDKIKENKFSSFSEMLGDESVIFAVNPGGTNQKFITAHLEDWAKKCKKDVQSYVDKRLVLIQNNNDVHEAIGQGYVVVEKLNEDYKKKIGKDGPKNKEEKIDTHVMVTDNVECLWKAKKLLHLKVSEVDINTKLKTADGGSTEGKAGYMVKKGNDELLDLLNDFIKNKMKEIEGIQKKHAMIIGSGDDQKTDDDESGNKQKKT